MWRATDSGTATTTSVGQGTPSRRLSSGRELKTRQGNRQWVARRVGSGPQTPARAGGRCSGGGAPRRRLSGHELKTRHGNRQWVARRVAMRRKTLQSPGNYRSRVMMARHRGRGGKTLQFVSMSGQKFVVDSGGRRMKRLSLSSSSAAPFSSSSPRLRLRSIGRSVSESQVTTTSVKQYLARCVYVSRPSLL